MTPGVGRTRTGGRLVAVEGIDGAGKSTLVRRLAAAWRRRGVRVVARREPADADLGRRAVGLGPRAPLAAGLLFTLDRALARDTLDRALARGDWVLLDRSFYSSLAYQGAVLTGAARRALVDLQAVATIRPDVVLWLDLPVGEALRRLSGRRRPRSALESRATLERVRRAYARFARATRTPRWVRLDARRDPEALARDADRALRAHGFAPPVRADAVRRR